MTHSFSIDDFEHINVCWKEIANKAIFHKSFSYLKIFLVKGFQLLQTEKH